MKKAKRLFERLVSFCWRFFASPEKYARKLGVKIGDYCFVSTRKWPSEPYLITVGNHVQITRDVSIFTHGGGNAIRKEHPNFDAFGKVVIEDWAYIGACSIIMPGVTIGEGALVAAGSVVTKSVPPHTVVGGNPARVLCTTKEYYQKNARYDVRTKQLSKAEKKRILLSLPEEKFISK